MERLVRLAGHWEAWLERLRPPRRAIPTRAGFFVLASPVPLGLAAVTASNNLLFMLLAAALSAIVISGILSERNLRGVRVRLRSVGAAWAGEPAMIRVSFQRPRGEGPGQTTAVYYGLRIRERGPSWNPLRPKTKRVERLDGLLPIFEGVEQDLILRRTFAQRGKVSLGRLELSTRYPFGLLEKSRDLDGEVEVYVRPRRVPLPTELRRSRAQERGGEPSDRRGIGLEPYGVRERNEWDEALRIHALRSLALGREVVLETVGVERPAAWLAVAGGSRTDPEAFERTLEYAAAALIAWHEAGWEVGLSLPGRSLRPGRTSLESMLDALATQEERVPTTRAQDAVWLVPRGAHVPNNVRAFWVSPDGGLEIRPA